MISPDGSVIMKEEFSVNRLGFMINRDFPVPAPPITTILLFPITFLEFALKSYLQMVGADQRSLFQTYLNSLFSAYHS